MFEKADPTTESSPQGPGQKLNDRVLRPLKPGLTVSTSLRPAPHILCSHCTERAVFLPALNLGRVVSPPGTSARAWLTVFLPPLLSLPSSSDVGRAPWRAVPSIQPPAQGPRHQRGSPSADPTGETGRTAPSCTDSGNAFGFDVPAPSLARSGAQD